MRSVSFGRGRAGIVARLGLLLLISLAAGCAPGKVKVSGRVLLNNGDPLPGGRLTFQPTDSMLNSVTAVVDPDGKYEAVLPVGEVHVCVDNRELAPPPPAGDAPSLPPEVRLKLPNGGVSPTPPTAAPKPATIPGAYKPIDPKYYLIETADIHFTVSAGQNKHDIPLK